ncbi:hypothetical protein ANCDUO_06636 [Ancylostoma duodenale]|uniref:Uncharacterized protein n=1 Tax=Ancylostoma duodenale TaxID=51022 RepID=A0A0C2GP17_9BILA|nr:hypothetical protein ANCDUO_06636 [Ancylostoma duodenale]
MNQKAREHMVGYLDANPDFLPQLHDLVPAEAGVLKASMACLKVGIVKDPRKWWDAPQALEFYSYLRAQLSDTLHPKEMKMPKSMRPTGQPSRRATSNVSGVPAIRDGRISKRHLRRVEKRKRRSLQRAAKKELSEMTLHTVAGTWVQDRAPRQFERESKATRIHEAENQQISLLRVPWEVASLFILSACILFSHVFHYVHCLFLCSVNL